MVSRSTFYFLVNAQCRIARVGDVCATYVLMFYNYFVGLFNLGVAAYLCFLYAVNHSRLFLCIQILYIITYKKTSITSDVLHPRFDSFGALGGQRVNVTSDHLKYAQLFLRMKRRFVICLMPRRKSSLIFDICLHRPQIHIICNLSHPLLAYLCEQLWWQASVD